jgi:hypothetical protein
METALTLKPIGHIENAVQDIRFDDWKNLVSRLVIDERYVEGLHVCRRACGEEKQVVPVRRT